MLRLVPVLLLILLVLFMPVFSIFVFIFVFVRIIQSEIRFDLGVVVEMVPAHVGRRESAAVSKAARGRDAGGQSGLSRRTELPRGTSRRRRQPQALGSRDS